MPCTAYFKDAQSTAVRVLDADDTVRWYDFAEFPAEMSFKTRGRAANQACSCIRRGA